MSLFVFGAALYNTVVYCCTVSCWSEAHWLTRALSPPALPALSQLFPLRQLRLQTRPDQSSEGSCSVHINSDQSLSLSVSGGKL